MFAMCLARLRLLPEPGERRTTHPLPPTSQLSLHVSPHHHPLVSDVGVLQLLIRRGLDALIDQISPTTFREQPEPFLNFGSWHQSTSSWALKQLRGTSKNNFHTRSCRNSSKTSMPPFVHRNAWSVPEWSAEDWNCPHHHGSALEHCAKVKLAKPSTNTTLGGTTNWRDQLRTP